MSLHRLRPADWVTGASGLVLLVALFLPWYTADGAEVSGWSAFAVVDLWLALTALGALAVLALTAVRDSPAIPVAADVLTWTVAVVAVVLVVVRLLALPGDATDREWGSVLGALAVLGVCAGAWWAFRDESAPGIRQPASVRAMHAPPAGTGPEPVAAET
jgi:hypothetical protein